MSQCDRPIKETMKVRWGDSKQNGIYSENKLFSKFIGNKMFAFEFIVYNLFCNDFRIKLFNFGDTLSFRSILIEGNLSHIMRKSNMFFAYARS